MATINPYTFGNVVASTNADMSTPASTNQSMSSISSSVAKGRKWMKVLCWMELVVAVFAFTLGSSCTGINAGHERTVCTFGTGIWVGLLSFCCSAVGLAAIQPTLIQRKLLVAYFVLCVMGCLASVMLLVISCMWIEKAKKIYIRDNEEYALTSITLNVCLLLAAICQTICTFLSAILLAHYYWGWCCRSSELASPIAYVRAEEVHDQAVVSGDTPNRPHLYARRNDPHSAASSTHRAPEMEISANSSNRFFF